MSSVTSDTSLEQTARVIALCLLAFLSIAASADTLTGKVVKVADGDSITVLDNNTQHRIRLQGIDEFREATPRFVGRQWAHRKKEYPMRKKLESMLLLSPFRPALEMW